MSTYLRQSTASQSRTLGPFVDDTDFKTLETGLTIANTDVKLMKNGAASVNKNSGGGTHRVNGEYSFTFDATDTDTVGELTVSIAATGALVVRTKFTVLEEAVYDQLFASAAPGAATTTQATAIETDTQDIQARLPAALVSGRIDAHVGSVVDGVLTAAKFAAGAFDAVWSVAARTLTAFGFSVTVGTNTDKAGYGLTATERDATADALLARDLGSGTLAGATNERTVRSALRFLRNRWQILSGSLTVTREDDTTTAWTAATTQTAGDPVSQIDPS